MGQEFVVKSTALEDKITQLLPSQGGFQAGVDISATTQIVPIIDLTETASGTGLREDLQKAIGFNNSTAFDVQNQTTTILNTTGFWRIFGVCSINAANPAYSNSFVINDGTTDKTILQITCPNGTSANLTHPTFDFIIELEAGHSFIITSGAAASQITGSAIQVASLAGVLTSPL